MVFPYRTLATIEPDLPPPCTSLYVGPGRCAGCTGLPPHPPSFYAQINEAPWHRPEKAAQDHGLGPWAKAVSAAAVFFLVSASVSLGALASRGLHPRGLDRPPARSSPPEAMGMRAAAPLPPPSQVDERREAQPIRLPIQEEEARPPARAFSGTGPVLALRTLGPPTHAPQELFRRASKLSAAGVNLVLTATAIAEPSLEDIEREIAPSARIIPTADSQGIRISSLPEGSIAQAAGLQHGDVVTAVNGHALSTPDALLEAYTSVRQSRMAVLEVRRGHRLVVLKVGLVR